VEIAEVLRLAGEAGVSGLPDLDLLSVGQVWPVGDRWVAEVGRGRARYARTGGTDPMFESMAEALAAVFGDLQLRRTELAQRLAGHEDQRVNALGGAVSRCAPPQVQVWDSVGQKDPRVVTGSV